MSERLDVRLVGTGLARSRGEARELIDGGAVLIDGRPALKAAQHVSPDARVEIAPGSRPPDSCHRGASIRPILPGRSEKLRIRFGISAGQQLGVRPDSSSECARGGVCHFAGPQAPDLRRCSPNFAESSEWHESGQMSSERNCTSRPAGAQNKVLIGQIGQCSIFRAREK